MGVLDDAKANRRRVRWWIGGSIGGTVVLAAAVCALLVFTGTLWPNRAFASAYPVRGVDISAYQGRIDWQVLASQNIDFAFIKATEGSSDRDSRFEQNWTGARSTYLLVGAYHFFSFDSAGSTQAQNVIRTVPVAAGALPVTVDLELYGRYVEKPPSKRLVRETLDPLLAALKARYGVPAIIYATRDTYDRYLRGSYEALRPFYPEKFPQVNIHGPLYVGIAEKQSLADRGLLMHLKRTRMSSLRRSLAALLCDELDLRGAVIPAPKGKFCLPPSHELSLIEFWPWPRSRGDVRHVREATPRTPCVQSHCRRVVSSVEKHAVTAHYHEQLLRLFTAGQSACAAIDQELTGSIAPACLIGLCCSSPSLPEASRIQLLPAASRKQIAACGTICMAPPSKYAC